VLTGINNSKNENYDDGSDKSECEMLKILVHSGDDSSVESDEWLDEGYKNEDWIEYDKVKMNVELSMLIKEYHDDGKEVETEISMANMSIPNDFKVLSSKDM